MPGKGQKSITLSGTILEELEIYYEDENKRNFYKVSFAQFIARHALHDVQREKR